MMIINISRCVLRNENINNNNTICARLRQQVILWFHYGPMDRAESAWTYQSFAWR